MISTRKSFLFVHVPKTGGNSIQNILHTFSDDDIVCEASHQDGIERFGLRNKNYNVKKHSTLSRYKSELEKETYVRLLKFATIRNPWDRVISFYFSPHRGSIEWNREDFKSFVTNIKPLRHYIYVPSFQERIARKIGFPLITGKLTRDIDFLIRFEFLQADFDELCNKLDMPLQKLPKRNVSKKRHYSTYYDEELVDIVRQRFSEEIEIGKYKFEEIQGCQ